MKAFRALNGNEKAAVIQLATRWHNRWRFVIAYDSTQPTKKRTVHLKLNCISIVLQFYHDFKTFFGQFTK